MGEGFFWAAGKYRIKLLDILKNGESGDLQSTIFTRNMDMKLSKT